MAEGKCLNGLRRKVCGSCKVYHILIGIVISCIIAAIGIVIACQLWPKDKRATAVRTSQSGADRLTADPLSFPSTNYTTLKKTYLGSNIDNANESRILYTTMAPITSSLDGGYIHETPSTNNEDSTVTTLASSTFTDASTTTEMYNSLELEKIGEEMKKDMDLSVNPCENFYEFACGNFLSSRTEDGKEHWKLNNNYFFMEQSDVIYENMIVEVKKIMEQLVDPLKDRKYVQNLKIAFNICKKQGLDAEKLSRKCALEIYAKLNLAAEFLFMSKIYQEINPHNFHSLIHYVTKPLMVLYEKAGVMNNSELSDALKRAYDMSRISAGSYSFFLNEAIIENATILINGSDWTHVEAYAQVLRQTLKDSRDYRDNKYPSLLESLKLHDTIESNKSNITVIIHVLWGMLQGVFYNPNSPNYMNYGALGSEIARYQFERLQNKWRHCCYSTVYSDSYKKMTISNDCIHGGLASLFKQLLGEGTPAFSLVTTKLDFVPPFNGIYSYKMAYLGYKKWVEDNGAEPQLTIGEKSYTPEQLFWINAARARCLAINPNNRINVTHYIERIPREYDINQYFLHLEEFEEAFHCSTNESFKLNPKNRVCPVP